MSAPAVCVLEQWLCHASAARSHTVVIHCFTRSGVRLNTRETRVLNAMHDRRLDLIEELIKRLPGYKPPADYRCEPWWHRWLCLRLVVGQCV